MFDKTLEFINNSSKERLTEHLKSIGVEFKENGNMNEEVLFDKASELINNLSEKEFKERINNMNITDMLVESKQNNHQEFYDKMKQIKEMLINKEIPESYPNEVSQFSLYRCDNDTIVDRFSLIKLSSFALISRDWVEPLSRWIGDKKCLEIMAGTGMLTKALKDYNIDIHATDDFSWGEEHANWFSDDSLFGEGMGGCTANDDFFNIRKVVYDTSFEKAINQFKSWFGIHDDIELVQ